jgi:hypothetical protein
MQSTEYGPSFKIKCILYCLSANGCRKHGIVDEYGEADSPVAFPTTGLPVQAAQAQRCRRCLRSLSCTVLSNHCGSGRCSFGYLTRTQPHGACVRTFRSHLYEYCTYSPRTIPVHVLVLYVHCIVRVCTSAPLPSSRHHCAELKIVSI